MNKEVIICLDEDYAGPKYDDLKEKIRLNTAKPDKPTYSQLLQKIDQRILELKKNPTKGDYIKKQNITKEVLKRYNTHKLFRIELVGYWRLLYTLMGHEDCIQILILDFIDHDEYNKVFNYKKK